MIPRRTGSAPGGTVLDHQGNVAAHRARSVVTRRACRGRGSEPCPDSQSKKDESNRPLNGKGSLHPCAAPGYAGLESSQVPSVSISVRRIEASMRTCPPTRIAQRLSPLVRPRRMVMTGTSRYSAKSLDRMQPSPAPHPATTSETRFPSTIATMHRRVGVTVAIDPPAQTGEGIVTKRRRQSLSTVQAPLAASVATAKGA